jgi:homoserine O-acetyltransferase
MNAAHAHLLLNHVPVYAEIAGALALGYGLVRKAEHARDIGLRVLVVAGVASVPAFVSGKNAAPIVAHLPGVERATMRLHHHASADALYAAIAVGVVALAVLVDRRRARMASFRGAVLVLAGSLVGSALDVRAAQLGGRIRHAETQNASVDPSREKDTNREMTSPQEPQAPPNTLAAAFPKSKPPAPDPEWPGQHEGDFTVADFSFASGERLAEVRLHYTTLGAPHRDAAGQIDNAILLLHGTMGRGKGFLAHPFGGAMFGAGQPFDTSRYFVVLPDAIGHGASSKPSDGLRARFPHYGYVDMVELQRRLVTERLGIQRLRVIAGTSMGGMHTWLWCTRYPESTLAAIPIAANPSAIRGRNLAWRRLIIEATIHDPDYRGGDYDRPPHGYVATLPLFQVMIDSTAHLQESLPDIPRATDFVRGDFGSGHAPVDPNDAIYALDASRDYDPSPDLERIRARVLAIQFADDEIIVPALAERDGWPTRVARSKLVVVAASPETRGHGTLALAGQWQREVADFLESAW